MHLQSRNSLIVLENKPLVTKGKGGAEGVIHYEVKKNICTVTYIQNKINEPYCLLEKTLQCPLDRKEIQLVKEYQP